MLVPWTNYYAKLNQYCLSLIDHVESLGVYWLDEDSKNLMEEDQISCYLIQTVECAT